MSGTVGLVAGRTEQAARRKYRSAVETVRLDQARSRPPGRVVLDLILRIPTRVSGMSATAASLSLTSVRRKMPAASSDITANISRKTASTR